MAAQPPHCPQICPYGLCAGWQRQTGVYDGMEREGFRSRVDTRREKSYQPPGQCWHDSKGM